MRVALVASSFLPEPGNLERRAYHLAQGLAARGAEVEIMAQGVGDAPVEVELQKRVTVRRFPIAMGGLRLPLAPGLCERLRLTAWTFDLVDVHTRHPWLAVAFARARPQRLVFTPGAPPDAFLGWQSLAATRALVGKTDRIVCRSEVERDRFTDVMPDTAGRTHVVPDGVDLQELCAAQPFENVGPVVLAVDRLDRATWVRRAIAAVPGLPPELRLVVIGDGPARGQLAAYAADLQVSSRVQFAGAVRDAVLYRWLRTARAVVTLASGRGSGSQVAEARAAGASLVASDIPIHHEAARRSSGGHVIYVPADTSPLNVADAINEAAGVSVLPSALGADSSRSWASVVDSTWMLYRDLLGADAAVAAGSGNGTRVSLDEQVRAERQALAASMRKGHRVRANGGRWWRQRRTA
jgi:glycosyltransferase involved in cell wall biosynthesis